jgi:hypothetical protein
VRINNISSFSYRVRTINTKPEKRQNVSFGLSNEFLNFLASIEKLPVIDRQAKIIGEMWSNDKFRSELIEDILQRDKTMLQQSLVYLNSAEQTLPPEIKNQKVFYELFEEGHDSHYYLTKEAAEEHKTMGDTMREVTIDTSKMLFIPYANLVELNKNLCKMIDKNLNPKIQEFLGDSVMYVKFDQDNPKAEALFIYEEFLSLLMKRKGMETIYTDGIRYEMSAHPDNRRILICCQDAVKPA